MATEVLIAGENPFALYAAQAGAGNTLKGDLLKFSKGDWTYGKSDRALNLNTTFVVDMHEILVGWQEWRDKRVVGADMGTVASGYKPAQRNTLGSMDSKEWDTDANGKPQDPWTLTSIVYLEDTATGEPFTFSTSSAGGRSAITDLVKSYAGSMADHPGEKPIVQLGVDSYKHTEWGKIFVPTIKIVGWTGSAAADLDGGGSLLETKAAPVTGKAAKF